MNENKSTWGIIVLKLNSFVHFLEETSAWKNQFEFVWPLVKCFILMIDIKPKILHHPYGKYSHKQIYGYFEH